MITPTATPIARYQALLLHAAGVFALAAFEQITWPGLFACLVVCILVCVAPLRAAYLALYGRRAELRVHLLSVLVWLAFVPVSWVMCCGVSREEERRMRSVVEAVERYHRQHRAYPATLDALVPVYLSELPDPRVFIATDGSSCAFMYNAEDHDATLFRPVRDGMSRRCWTRHMTVYVFNSRRWTHEDPQCSCR